MPEAQEKALKRAARSLASKGKLKTGKKYKTMEEAQNAFVYGTLRHKYGWTPGKRKRR